MNIQPETLLFQSGYLTIGETLPRPNKQYSLIFPNFEIKTSFNYLTLSLISNSPIKDVRFVTDAVINNTPEVLKEQLDSLFAAIPYNWKINTPIGVYEGYYASIIFALFSAAGYTVIAEDATNKGRIDMTALLPNLIWLFEFKVIGAKRTSNNVRPIKQMFDKGYAEKYKSDGREVRQIGIVFDADRSEICKFTVY